MKTSEHMGTWKHIQVWKGVTGLRLLPECPKHGFKCVEKPFEVDFNDWCHWLSGEYVQVAFKHLSVDNRERLMTGYCPQAFLELFGSEDDI